MWYVVAWNEGDLNNSHSSHFDLHVTIFIILCAQCTVEVYTGVELEVSVINCNNIQRIGTEAYMEYMAYHSES